MSQVCGRFESEGIERLERGEPLDDHFRHCDPCRAAKSGYERVRSGLTRLPPEGAPPPDWEAKVWAGIYRRDVKRRAWRLAPIFASALAAVAVVIAWPGSVAPPGLEIKVRAQSAEVVRSVSAKPGDVLQVRGHTGGQAKAELRVYRDGVLVFRCGDQTPCKVNGTEISAEVPLQSVGRHESVLLLSDRPLAPPGTPHTGAETGMNQGMSQDLDAAISSGGKVLTTGAVDVF